MFLRKQIDKVL